MSGIAGIIHFDGRPVEPGQIQAMTASMSYRGPDGVSHWCQGHVALGHCLLRSTPESAQETQPLCNEDQSLVLVMDGRIDNWEDLGRLLLAGGAVLRNRSDAELVLRAYELWGRDCLLRIEGDFALVIWDARAQEAFCARDRVGSRQLHYAWRDGSLVFATDLLPVWNVFADQWRFHDGLLVEYLCGHWQSLDETFWQGLMRLTPAHGMRVSRAGVQLAEYWRPDFDLVLRYRRDEEYAEHYRALLIDVVRRMFRSSAPVACEVSGGLDSSALFCVAEYLHARGDLAAPGVKGYVLDFAGDPRADELSYSDAVGAHWGRSITRVPPTKQPLSWYEEMATTQKIFPDYPNGVMSQGIGQRASADGCRVLVSGLGGDEWLGGWGLGYAESLLPFQPKQMWRTLCGDAREADWARAMWWMFRHGPVARLPEWAKAMLRAVRYRKPSIRADFTEWLTDDLKEAWRQRALMSGERALPGPVRRVSQHLQWAQLRDAFTLFSAEAGELQAAMNGLDWRRPLWNPAIVQFAFSVPDRLRSSHMTNRLMHRQAMQGLMPEVVLSRQSKANFMCTFDEYLPQLCERHTAMPGSRAAAWVRPDKLAGLQEKLYHSGKFEKYGGWPELMVWTLFGCLAVRGQR
jgi:asparagine synthase (glutamine-hydrolysing)